MNYHDPATLSRLYHDFDFFLDCLWKEMRWPANALTQVERDLFNFSATGPRMRCVLGFRGIGKSTGTSIGMSLWRLFRDPQRKILIVSKSKGEATKTLTTMKECIERCPFLHHLRSKPNQQNNLSAFDVGPKLPNRQASVSVFGIEGQLEGNRAHTIIGDDIETKRNSMTVQSREDLRRMVGEFTNILYPDIPREQGGPVDPTEIVIVQTPKHEDTIILTLQRRGYAVRAWPIAYPKSDEPTMSLSPMLQRRLDSGEAKPGDPTCPARFGNSEVAVRRASGRREWLLEFQMATAIKDQVRYPLRLEEIICWDVPKPPAMLPLTIAHGKSNHNGSTKVDMECVGFDGDGIYGPIQMDNEWGPATRTVAAIDPAGRGVDKTGFSIGSSCGGYIFVHHVSGRTGGISEEALEPLVLDMKAHGVTECVWECNIDFAGTGQQTLERLIRKHSCQPGQQAAHPKGWTCGVKPIRSLVRKHERICSILEPLFGSRRVVMDKSALQVTDHDQPDNNLQFQIVNITREERTIEEDGQIDSLAMLCEELQTVGRLDSARMKELNQRRELEQLREDREKYRRQLWGEKPKSTTTALRNFTS